MNRCKICEGEVYAAKLCKDCYKAEFKKGMLKRQKRSVL